MPCAAIVIVMIAMLPGAAGADQASQPGSPAAASIVTGNLHSCALVASAVRCWGYGADGQLGYGNGETIGDDETPASSGPVDVGAGRSVVALAGSAVETCALLDDGSVRCWGFGGEGRLGYKNTDTVGDDEAPGSVGPVDLGDGRTAKAITVGGAHTCAILDDDSVRCWGFGFDGRLGYGNPNDIGDDEVPGSVGPVKLGPGHTAKAITAGLAHTCAILDDDSVRCWGFGGNGRLGYSGTANQGDDPARTPDKLGAVDIGDGRTAKAISAGGAHTCAILDDDSVRCWGSAASGRLGYGNGWSIGDDETPGSVEPVDLGPGRTATAISTGGEHSCAILDNGAVRCWGFGAFGQLGYGNGSSVGNDETPGSVGPVDLGAGRTAVAISTGALHTCARLDDGSVRCWGDGANGRLGYCGLDSVGDDEAPGSRGPVDVGEGGEGCPVPEPTATPGPDAGEVALAAALERQAGRARAFRACRRAAAKRPKAKRERARAACGKRFGRVPGRVGRVRARAVSASRVVLRFAAVGSDGDRLPAARSYVVRQSRRPIRSGRDFRRASSLCGGACGFDVSRVGAPIRLSVTDLVGGGRYFYAVAARDNVSDRVGRRSAAVKVRTKAGTGGRARPGLSGRVRPGSDRRKPFQFDVTGRLKLPKGVSKSDGCAGQVSVKIARARRGRDKTVSSRRVAVRGNCRFTHKKTFGARRLKRDRGTLRFVVRFQGNDVLKPSRIVRKAEFGPQG